MSSFHHPVTLSALVTLTLVAPAWAQLTLPHEFEGEQASDLFGRAIASIDDVDSDGVRDFLVGAPWHSLPGLPEAGVARVFSGRDGVLLRSHFGGNSDAGMGHAVADVGDVDADGVGDYAVTAPADDTLGWRTGAVHVISGATGSAIHVLLGPGSGAGFGNAVAGAGDVDGDGHDDVLVGAVFEGAGGSVRVLSGFDGSTLYTHLGTNAERTGRGMQGAGDVDGDGRDDYLAAIHSARRIELRSGATGQVIRAFDGGAAGSGAFFGRDLDLIADLDGDGLDDVLVNDFGTTNGSVWVFSSASGAVLWRRIGTATAALGGTVSRAGDVDRDGTEDVLVGVNSDVAAGPSAGRVDVLSGRTGALVKSIPGAPGERFGGDVAAAGDVDGDGVPDLFVGATRTNGALQSPGVARLLSGRSFDAIGARFCSPAIPNSTGAPAVLHAFGFHTVGANDVVLVASQLPPSSTGFFLTSRTQGFANPPGSAGFLCLGGSIGRYVAPGQIVQGPVGRLVLDLAAMPTSPSVAVVAGESWSFQCWYRDGAPGSSNLSDAVEVTFQ